MTESRPAAVEQFLSASRPERADLIAALDRCIRSSAPELAVEVSGKFLGYGPFHYRYATGREGDTYVVSMMDGVQALSVYVMGLEGDTYLAQANAARLGKVSVGKSCIRIKRVEHIDLEVLGQVVRKAADQRAAAD